MTNIHGFGSSHLQRSDSIDKTETLKMPQPGQGMEIGNSAPAKHDATSLSAAGSLLASEAADGQEIRAGKVEAIRAAMNNGTYSVSSSDVAEKMLKSMLGG